ncbi:hypothetical protein EKO27_g9852 [Xylaria grammica]|uniref:Uncharacterized protein n=1 Tax=Xylaria grammica TaxID=363999 RepID=A0A439CSX4_9PEZI|nr:hypothetical protein EKO27_g9852 [Xylaria grammica]
MITIRTHEEAIANLCKLPVPIHRDFQHELDNIVSELQNHEQTVQELLSVSNDIGLMYDGVLKYYGQELLHNNSLRLTQIAQNDAYETRTMAALADKTFQDSRTVRIATVIAMFYLPANLVTVRIVRLKNFNFPRSAVNGQVLIHSAAVIFQHHIDLVRQFWAEFHLENPPRGLDRGVDDASLSSWHKASLVVVGTV